MKKILILIPIIFLAVLSCQKEPAPAPSAKIHTSLVHDSVAKLAKFWLYLDKTNGEFITYYKGDGPKKTYSADNFTATGIIVDENVDSVEIAGYGIVGQYTFTLLARSFGNWGDEERQAIDSTRITVY